MYRRRVENKSPHPASTQRTEAREDPPRTGLSQSSDRPNWADKLKTPQMTTALQSRAPATPDPRDQELRALRAEVSRLTTLLTPPSVPPSSPTQHPSRDPIPPSTQEPPDTSPTSPSPPHKKKRIADAFDGYHADLKNFEAKFDAKLAALEARIEAKFTILSEQLSTRLEQQMDTLFTRLAQTLEQKFTQFETRLHRLETLSNLSCEEPLSSSAPPVPNPVPLPPQPSILAPPKLQYGGPG